MKILQEFKEFAMRGSVLDLAVGVIIGSAFGKIVTSLVADIIMPPIGLLVGGLNFTSLKLQLKPAQVDGAGKIIKEALTLNYGNFLQSTVDFLIIAFSIFLFIKLVNSMKKKIHLSTETQMLSQEVRLLTDIRDLLKKENNLKATDDKAQDQ